MASKTPRRRTGGTHPKSLLSIIMKAFDYSTDGIVLIWEGGEIFYHNKAWLDIHALDRNTDLRGKLLGDIERKELLPIVERARAEVLKSGHYSYQFGTVRRDGKYHDVYFSADRIPGTDPPVFAVILKEVTDLVRMKSEVARRNVELSLLDEIHSAITRARSKKRLIRQLLNLLGGFIGAEAGGVYLIDYSKGYGFLIESIGVPTRSVAIVRQIPLTAGAFKRIAASRRTFVVEEDLPNYDGGRPDLRVSLGVKRTIGFVFRTGTKRNYIVLLGLKEAKTIDPDIRAFFDIAAKRFGTAIERMELLETLKRREAELHDLTVRLIDSGEEERRQCSLMLHDEVGQALTALKLELEMLDRNLSPLNPCTRKSLEAIRKQIRFITEGTRSISKSLHPAMLDELGLIPTLNWYIDNFVRSKDLEVEFVDAGFDEDLPVHAALALYRVAQESFTNVLRHAAATKVIISLTKGYPYAIMEIEDNGQGISLEKGKSIAKGLGLVSMRERVESIGGLFQIRSSPGKGTRIRVKIPIEA